MRTEEFQDPTDLTSEFQRLANFTSEDSWNKEDITISGLNHLIHNNLRLILEQTENPRTAPGLQSSLNALHRTISKVKDSPEARKLAFEIMGYANGLFNVGLKPDWGQLPRELLEKEIFNHIVPKDTKDFHGNFRIDDSDLRDASRTSKGWRESALSAKKDWINSGKGLIPRFETIKEHLQYIANNQLLSAQISHLSVSRKEIEYLAEKCPNLLKLSIDESDYNYNLPIGRFQHLTDLYVGSSILKRDGNGILDEISKLSNLEHLSLTDCSRLDEDKLVEILSKLTNLKSLTLFRIKDGDKIAKAILKLPSLSSLTILSNELKGDGLLDVISQLPNLTKLTFNAPLINGDKIAETISRLQNLINLNLYDCGQITEEKLADAIKNLPNLERLTLRSCPQLIGDKLLDAISLLKKIRKLDFTECKNFVGEKLGETISQLQFLTKLILEGCEKLQIEPKRAMSYHPNLQVLDLWGCKQLDSDKLADFLLFPKLTYLSLANCGQLEGTKLLGAISKLSELKYLNLEDCKKFDGDQLLDTITLLTNLEELDLENCPLNKEEKLWFSKLYKWITRIPPEVKLSEILKQRPHLIKLNLKNCGIGDKLKELREKFPKTKIEKESWELWK